MMVVEDGLSDPYMYMIICIVLCLQISLLNHSIEDVDSSVTSVTGVRSKAAKLLPFNIAARPAPSTAELVEQHVSRKKMKAAEI